MVKTLPRTHEPVQEAGLERQSHFQLLEKNSPCSGGGQLRKPLRL